MMRRYAMGVRRAALGGLVLLAAGCGSPPPPPPPPATLALAISAAADVNPDAHGAPAPIVVRVYELASPSSFQAASYFQLFDKEAATLGADLQGRDEIALSPGETKTIERPLKPATRFIGVAASYRDIDHASWHSVLAVGPSGPIKLRAAIAAKSETLAASEAPSPASPPPASQKAK